ncbi:MAG: hypothetical protein HC836_13085 [Richelia sp. RM2_1_2]|nr:hypothetical protein [Richelia sp. SM1_7_0]NJN09539.1 hypothetical protein [Richelia sp. RM1_1_1]NJO59216.1 hypothetical protein [Richelia sp. RM2_1_2]
MNQVFIPAYSDTNWLSPVLNTQTVCFWKMQDAVLRVEQTSSTRSHKQSLSVLRVDQTSSTTRRSRGEGTGRIHWRSIATAKAVRMQNARRVQWHLVNNRPLAKIFCDIVKGCFDSGLTQLSQAMAREACRAPKNYTENIEISGRFSCSIK